MRRHEGEIKTRARATRRRRQGAVPVAALVLLAGVAGCAASGDVGNPLVRKATWFSYLNGDDLRAGCRPGAEDVVRLVFNGVYAEHVRIHEARRGGAGLSLATRVIPGAADLSSVPVEGLGSLLDPWRGATTVAPLSPDAWAALTAALARDGLEQSPPRGLQLDSTDHYWVVSGCLDGHIVFNAWQRGTARYDALTFDDVLGRETPAIGPLPAYEPAARNSFEDRRRQQFRFLLRVGPTGLRDLPALSGPG